ncbi:MAG TPA: amino acid ABC transporter permease [Candidatus Limnocylindrales bacterium]|jgi:polar amino acid transport system permease protein
MARSIGMNGIRRVQLAGFLLLLALVVSACASNKGSTYNFQWDITFRSIVSPNGSIINGLWLTIGISIFSQLLGVVLGILAALARMSRILPFRIISNLYIWFFRGTPLIVQLVFFYYGPLLAHVVSWPAFSVGPFNFTDPAVIMGAVILGVNEGAYMAEIVRAGIMAVDPGQTEAAKSLGMPYRLTMTRIVLPQAARVIIPPLGNEFNNMIKNTSLLYVLAVFELFKTFQSYASTTLIYFEYMAACCFWYLVLTTIWGVVQGRIERRFSKGTGAASSGLSWRERLMSRGKPDEITVLGGH